ncbi:RND superfamily putative drug exporter [Trueperella bonasi]|uniref:RND superfamily putative drug exporter n=1 Tax=Trueperella bonasi TaxID=312286 RepID=A0ABT9NEZ6_9ACTO|nr:MMPL family transporter [Trueperella bonasi]MDP9805428.1 RND superfamily putative drug exporter [Trueperella bonasi]
MFDRLGHAIARRPKLFVLGWVVLVLVGGLVAVWGAGHGNLFHRMESSESMVPGSESDIVVEKVSEDSSAALVVVTGVRAADVEAELVQFRSELGEIDGVRDVNDPVAIDDEFTSAIEQAVDDAVTQALNDNQEAIQQAEEAAVAQAAPQITLGGQAVEEQVRQQAREIATEEIESQARLIAETELAETVNPAEEFTSENGFIIAVLLDDEDATQDLLQAAEAFEAAIQQVESGAEANVNSADIMESLILEMVKNDLIRGEAIGLPIALFLLVVVFGGLLAAGLPLIGAITSIAIGMGLLWALTFFTNVDTFILNIITIIGLALSIDYGLLIVSRYREEIAEILESRGIGRNGQEVPKNVDDIVDDAVTTTVSTAGRTVSFSALTIAFSIAGLYVMDAPMLKMIAIGGVIVTILAVATAVTLVPALMKLLGRHLIVPSWLSQRKGFGTLVEKVGDSASDEGFFSRLAKWVHDRPIPILIAVTAILLVMAAPVRDLQMRSNFIEYVPASSDAAQAYEQMQEYPAFASPSGTIVAEAPPAQTTDLANFVENLDGVERVSDPKPLGDGGTRIDFYVPAQDQVGSEVTDVVEEIRNYEPGYETYVGGSAALQMDFNQSVIDGAPLAAVIVVLAVLILLFLMTGSIMAPLKALLINTLSLVAGMGATVFVFDNGLFGMPQTNGLETFVVAAAIAFGFGLAMDYEVFLLARIKEYWDSGEDNDTAVEKGLQRSGRIITSAAAIIVAVFIGFLFGEMLAIKQIGVALALIVIIDATLVRMLLVPATMTLLGKWNWWAPKPLKRIYEKFKIVH